MVDAHANFAYSTVATAPSPATSGTSLTVATGGGALFPAVPFNATVWPVGVLPLASNAEVVRVTNIAGDVLTISRHQESSSARTIVVGDQIAATITAKTLTDAEHPSTLYDATAGTASLIADNGAVTVQVGVDFTSHGKLSKPPDGFTFNSHIFPTWFDPTVTPEAWNTAGWFAFDFDGSAHAWVSQHWGFGNTQGASMTVGSASNHLDIFSQTGQTVAGLGLLSIWDEDGTTLRWNVGDTTVNSTGWFSHDQHSTVFIYADNNDPEIVIDNSSAGGHFNMFVAGARGGMTCSNPNTSSSALIQAGDETVFDLVSAAGHHTFRVDADTMGFFDAALTAKPTGVAVTAAGIHAALVTLGLIAA